MKPWVLRMPVTLLLLFAAYVLAQSVANALQDGPAAVLLVGGLALAAGLLALYPLLTRWLEDRPRPVELRWDRSTAGLGWGALLGAGFIALTVAGIAPFGGVGLSRGEPVSAVLGMLGAWVLVGVGEELLFRGGLFRLVEERRGSGVALAVSAVVFGGAHLTNQDATVWGAVAIALEAGGLLGAAYVLSRSLWLPIGIHIAWNLTQGTVFGAEVSGNGPGGPALLHTRLSGPDWLTGGGFGPEGSVVAVLIGVAVTVVMLVLARRRGSWVAWVPRPR
ncbi:CPBP family intramembrane glutamic endopeptidase [Cellulomonas denverensis]|uniref:CPBP family intramembrane metalloprotease n=1 Tax=Cellulomonas denverensis TaxID=264297 RepID=A0A7X6QZ61_9CELL|nr:type II CAAX endopeptidase family protein [Cellulomonas denverensis]NKY22751.1 CPBP family intramembrane metalloprotease [Cellulomonas denverensis]GIG26215.1 CAAX amino protease [Cellulomonas denverensis]